MHKPSPQHEFLCQWHSHTTSCVNKPFLLSILENEKKGRRYADFQFRKFTVMVKVIALPLTKGNPFTGKQCSQMRKFYYLIGQSAAEALRISCRRHQLRQRLYYVVRNLIHKFDEISYALNLSWPGWLSIPVDIVADMLEVQIKILLHVLVVLHVCQIFEFYCP